MNTTTTLFHTCRHCSFPISFLPTEGRQEQTTRVNTHEMNCKLNPHRIAARARYAAQQLNGPASKWRASRGPTLDREDPPPVQPLDTVLCLSCTVAKGGPVTPGRECGGHTSTTLAWWEEHLGNGRH